MTGKERMLIALGRGKPDRLPVTIHQWQRYHLQQFMGGMDQVQAFEATGLDASVTPLDISSLEPSSSWCLVSEDLGVRDGHRLCRYRIDTPQGQLTWMNGENEYTSFVVEHPIKTERDAEMFLTYWPDTHLDQQRLGYWYDRTGDLGIVRGFVAAFAQPGPWQEFCEMVGTERAILWAIDDPAFVHRFLEAMTRRKIEYIHREMRGARFDLIEHGGGAASSTVISPAMFDEFCLPYDRRIIAALHEEGFRVVYHTCGGMMAILDHIPLNGADASETLSPPGVGGDIKAEQQQTVKRVLGTKVALIGGIDQGWTLTEGSAEDIRREVTACFKTFGKEGGYICSASDHFFHTPAENLMALAAAGRECAY